MDVTGKTRIFRYDGDGYTNYSRGISSRKFVNGEKTDEWVTEYEKVQFPKGTDLPNKTDIEVTKAFEAVTEYKDKKYRKLVVQEFKVIDGESQKNDEEPVDDFEAIDEDVPF